MRQVSALLSTVLVLAVSAGCSTRQQAPGLPTPPPVDDLAALIDRGCYRCLEEAFEEAQARDALEQAFEAAVLLVLRSKELGMSPDRWMERAEALAAMGGPPDGGPHIQASDLYLDIARAIPPDPLSGDRDAMLNLQGLRGARASLPKWRDALSSGQASNAFRAYLDVSLVCTLQVSPEHEQSMAVLVERVPDVPLLHYRIGICDRAHAARLAALRESEADFVDADFALGRYALEDPDRPDPENGLERLRAAAAAFPLSSAIATSIANLYRSWEDWMPALTAYEAALAVIPHHPDALLGRTVSLSNLSRRQEAIETATQLIDRGSWFVGEAHYWRAWNHLQLGDHQAARSDADRARGLIVNAGVLVLSGLVDWRLVRLDTAESELQAAMELDFGHCDAPFYLGLVRDQRAKAPEALAAFIQARQCYELAITVRREAIAKILTGPGSETTKARDVARQQRAVGDLENRRQEAVQAVAALEKAIRATPRSTGADSRPTR